MLPGKVQQSFPLLCSDRRSLLTQKIQRFQEGAWLRTIFPPEKIFPRVTCRRIMDFRGLLNFILEKSSDLYYYICMHNCDIIGSIIHILHTVF